MQNPYKLLIFDWDGTLMDSVARIVGSFQAAIQQAQLPPRQDHEIEYIIGLGLKEAVFALYPDINTQQQTALLEAYRHQFLHACQIEMPLFAGVHTVLTELKQQGFILAVATGKSRAGLKRAFQDCDIGDWFACSRTADETCSKPDPQMLQEIMQSLNYKPSETLMIGDSIYDLEMAQNAGVASIAVDYGVHGCARLQACDPLGCIDAITELPHFINLLTQSN